MTAPVTVSSMAGTRQTPLALRCLGSLKRYYAHPLTFAIYSDGTLTEADRENFQATLGSCQFLERTADDSVAEQLAKYPHCQEFRRTNLFATKLLDIPLRSRDRIVYCDTDILFTRPFSCAGFFERADTPFVGMRDLAEQYSVRIKDWRGLAQHRIQLASRLCAGFLAFEKSAHDLDYIEWLLSLDPQTHFFSAFPFWAEQTIYAALAARAGCSYVDPEQCVLAHPRSIKRTPTPAIIHFAGFHRHYIDDLEPTLDFQDARPPISLDTIPTPVCTLPRRLLSAIRKRAYL